MTTVMSLTEANARLSEVVSGVSGVSGQDERVAVTGHTTPSAVLLASVDPEPLEETLAIRSDPGTMRRTDSSDSELVAGEDESESDLVGSVR